MNAIYFRLTVPIVFVIVLFYSISLLASENVGKLSESDFSKNLHKRISCNSFLNSCYLKLNNGSHVLFRHQKQSNLFCSLNIPLKGNNETVFDNTNINFIASSYAMDKLAYHLNKNFDSEEISTVKTKLQSHEPLRILNISFHASNKLIVDILETVKVPIVGNELAKDRSTSMFTDIDKKIEDYMQYDEVLVANEVMKIAYHFTPFTMKQPDKLVVSEILNNSLDSDNFFWEISGEVKDKKLLAEICKTLTSIKPRTALKNSYPVYRKKIRPQNRKLYKVKSPSNIHLAYTFHSTPITSDLYNAVDFISWMLEQEIRSLMSTNDDLKKLKFKRMINTDGIFYFSFYNVNKHNLDYFNMIFEAIKKVEAYEQTLLDKKKKEFMLDKWTDFKMNDSLNKRYNYMYFIIQDLQFDHEFQQFFKLTKYITPKNIKRTMNELFKLQYELSLKPR